MSVNPLTGVRIAHIGHVGTITLDRPPHNFVNATVLATLVAAARELQAAGARALVLDAAGKNFSAGADLGNGVDPNDPRARHIYDVAVELFEIGVPIVAAVQGKAVGAGVGLALVADLRVAAAETRFITNFARLGFCQGFGMTHTLPRLIGASRAAEMLYTGRPVTGSEAARIGLVDYLEEPGSLSARAVDLATAIAASAPLAVRSVRRLLRGELAATVAAVLRSERAEQERLMQTADFREGVAAANERREPDFAGC
jgi:enoyl-CoA hydratase/carnithine racemase